MKNRFTTTDLQAIIGELRPRLVGMRAANIYDIDKKTYLIKLARPPDKAMLLIESGIRIHTTEYDWPKCDPPAAFAMKCRKHIRTRRLTGLSQVGTDRVLCLTFGANETAYHLIVELYDKGNILLCDHQYVILSLLRPRSEGDSNVKFAVHERYPIELAHLADPVTIDGLRLAFESSTVKPGDPLRKHLNPLLPCGPAVIEHALLSEGFPPNAKVGQGFVPETDLDRLFAAVQRCYSITEDAVARGGKGYIILKKQTKPTNGGAKGGGDGGSATTANQKTKDGGSDAATVPPTSTPTKEAATFFDEFHPLLLKQHEQEEHREFETFDRAVDVFFSEMEAQKMEMRTLQKEQAALKKLENVKNDHERRLKGLKHAQELNTIRAELIELNVIMVDKAIQVINSALATSMEWKAIEDMVAEAASRGDEVAGAITALKLDHNTITMRLTKPFADSSSSDDNSSDNSGSGSDGDGDSGAARQGKARKSKKQNKGRGKGPKGTSVDIDLSMTAFANARALYDTKRSQAKKEQKTIEASEQALRNAEVKTTAALKQVQVQAKMAKSRKSYWFEKFLWFISSENYLIVGGRDRQQNEQIVRRYLTKGDIYVHADFHGASSCVIKNPTGGEVPPKTLSEAGAMAASFSSAWDAKIVTGAYWVHHDQVSKSAPTGEYLTTGAFMIRGKKNFLAPVPLVVGYGLLFKVDETCIANHVGERAPRQIADDSVDDTSVKDAARRADSLVDDKARGEEEDDGAGRGGNMALSKETAATQGKDVTTADAKGHDEKGNAEEDGQGTNSANDESEDSDNNDEPAYPEAAIRVDFSSSKPTASVAVADVSSASASTTTTTTGTAAATASQSSDPSSLSSSSMSAVPGKAGAARSAKEKRDARRRRAKGGGGGGGVHDDEDASSIGSGMDDTQFDFEDEEDADVFGPDDTHGKGGHAAETEEEECEDDEEQEEGMEEGDEEDNDDEAGVGETLDVLMGDCYEFIGRVASSDPERAPDVLFDVLFQVFEHRILQTYQTKHVQYLLFYVCSFSAELPQHFVSLLLERSINPRLSQLQRQTAVAYIGSFVARADYISMNVVEGTLTTLADAALEYCRSHHRPTQTADCIVFYAQCQALFYIICFRLRDLVATDSGAALIASLHLDSIVGSSLCPLQVCQKGVVNEFMKITKAHQVLYCAQYVRRRHSVLAVQIEGFHRGLHDGVLPAHQLQDFFPFDPYLLPQSAHYIKDMYRVWVEEQPGAGDADSDGEEDDDASGSGSARSGDEDDDDFLGSSSLDSSQPSPRIGGSRGGGAALYAHAHHRAASAGAAVSAGPRPIRRPENRRLRQQAAVAGFLGSPISPFSASTGSSGGHTRR
eukprot:m.80823 g.80823  ORF g.80823 m.80823 type:complete len:1353 (+) comp9372_c0_seq3:96-4154(+)